MCVCVGGEGGGGTEILVYATNGIRKVGAYG